MTIHWHLGYQFKNRPYVIESVLGQGGFGITYKVRHLTLNQHFVIKVPNDYLKEDPEYDRYIEKFTREARILAKLGKIPYPNIVRTNDLFKEDDNYCLVMDFVSGKTLFKIVEEGGRLRSEIACKYVRQIGTALIKVHKEGLVHRDVNPVNIMIQEEDVAVLIDFGIAKNILPSTNTTTDRFCNKSFAPYEQILDGSRDKRVDVYSLAASLYYAVTGSFPTDCLRRKVGHQPIVPAKEIVDSLRDELNQAILAGMALEPEDRPQSIEEWLDLLPSFKISSENSSSYTNLPSSKSSQLSWKDIFTKISFNGRKWINHEKWIGFGLIGVFGVLLSAVVNPEITCRLGLKSNYCSDQNPHGTVVTKNRDKQKQRIALVIGNSDYQNKASVLSNPVNDANDMAVALEELNFEVIKLIDSDQQAMEVALNSFYDRIKNGAVSLFYYAGHTV